MFSEDIINEEVFSVATETAKLQIRVHNFIICVHMRK